MGASRDRHANLQVPIDQRVVAVLWSLDRELTDRRPVEQHLDLVRLRVLQPVDIAGIAARLDEGPAREWILMEIIGYRMILNDRNEALPDIGMISGPHRVQRTDQAMDDFRGLDVFLDLLLGGVGMRRGRPDPDGLKVGDTLDWWRVEAYEADRLLRLRAEMKLPGRAWLEFEVVPREGGATIRQTALFDPVGVTGLAYWYGLYPLHRLIFSGMLEGIARAATNSARSARSSAETDS